MRKVEFNFKEYEETVWPWTHFSNYLCSLSGESPEGGTTFSLSILGILTQDDTSEEFDSSFMGLWLRKKISFVSWLHVGIWKRTAKKKGKLRSFETAIHIRKKYVKSKKKNYRENFVTFCRFFYKRIFFSHFPPKGQIFTPLDFSGEFFML